MRCAQCFRVNNPHPVGLSRFETVDHVLKQCEGCYSVSYCSTSCRKLASKFHKIECPWLRRLRTNNELALHLRPMARGALQILAKRRAKLISEADWRVTMSLKYDYHTDGDDMYDESETTLTRDLMSLLGFPTCQEKELNRLLGVLCARGFLLHGPLPNARTDLVGVIFDPLMAILSHNCQPNAYIRYDVSPSFTQSSVPNPVFGGISVHAIHPIAAGEKITISFAHYLTISARPRRELQTYDVFCKCDRCKPPTAVPQPSDQQISALKFAREVLAGVQNSWQECENKVLYQAMRAMGPIRHTIVSIALTGLARAAIPIDTAIFVELRTGFINELLICTAYKGFGTRELLECFAVAMNS